MENNIKSIHLLIRLINRLNNEKVEPAYTNLAQYLINNYFVLEKLTIENVCDDNFISKSTLRRFCQSLGYENFSELKECKEQYEFPAVIENGSLKDNILKGINDCSLDENKICYLAETIMKYKLVFILFPYPFYSPLYSFQQLCVMNNKSVCLVPNIDNIFPNIRDCLGDSLVIIFDTDKKYTQSALSYVEKTTCKIILLSSFEGDKTPCYEKINIPIKGNYLSDKYLINYFLDELFLKMKEIENEK